MCYITIYLIYLIINKISISIKHRDIYRHTCIDFWLMYQYNKIYMNWKIWYFFGGKIWPNNVCQPWLEIWHILSILDSLSNWIKEVHKKQLGKIVVEKQQYTNLTNRSIGGQLSNVKNGIHILVHSNNWSKVANKFFALSDLDCFSTMYLMYPIYFLYLWTET